MGLSNQPPSSHSPTAPVHPPKGSQDLLSYTTRRGATEIKALKKELQRKEKALAEAAALLVLRKKWEAFCSEDEEG